MPALPAVIVNSFATEKSFSTLLEWSIVTSKHTLDVSQAASNQVTNQAYDTDKERQEEQPVLRLHLLAKPSTLYRTLIADKPRTTSSATNQHEYESPITINRKAPPHSYT